MDQNTIIICTSPLDDKASSQVSFNSNQGLLRNHANKKSTDQQANRQTGRPTDDRPTNRVTPIYTTPNFVCGCIIIDKKDYDLTVFRAGSDGTQHESYIAPTFKLGVY